MNMATWYFAGPDRKVTGPLETEELASDLAKTASPHDALVWKEGFSDWIKARDVPEISHMISAPLVLKGPPPLPPLFASDAIKPTGLALIRMSWAPRMRRSNFVGFMILLSALSTMTTLIHDPTVYVVGILFIIAHTWVISMRLHDSNTTALHIFWMMPSSILCAVGVDAISTNMVIPTWSLLIFIFSIFAFFAAIGILLLPGTKGWNRFGPDPRTGKQGPLAT